MNKIKAITKKQFQEMAFPTWGEGKELFSPKMDLKPVNRGVINGNEYKIETLEDRVELTFIKRIEIGKVNE